MWRDRWQAVLAVFCMAGVKSGAADWAWQPLARPPVPAVVCAGMPPHPVDAFILADGRRAAGREADRRTLLRRVSFGLTGLPPDPSEIARFLADAAPDAFERAVDRLLCSPRFGERWARLWMDAAHFAETHGHDQDRIREHAWPYRDYLIDSFNAGKPFARFIEEQIAGDVSFPDDPRATIALGFLAAGPWDESSLRDIREDTLDRQIGRYLDRDDMISTAIETFCSVTVRCARCHDHKFDPIPQRDYYALQAVFAGVDRANRRIDVDGETQRRRRELERQIQTRAGNWRTPRPVESSGLHSALLVRDDGSIMAQGDRPPIDVSAVTLRDVPAGVMALRIEALTDESLPMRGPGRADNGNFHLSEIEVFAGERRLALRDAVASFDQKDWEVGRAIDGDEQTAWGIHPQEGRDHWAVFSFDSPAPAGPLRVVLRQLHGRGHVIGRFRVSVSTSIPPEVELARLPPPQLVYAAASEFEPDGGLVPTRGVPRAIQFLVRGEVTRPLDAVNPGALSACHVPFPAADFSIEGNRRASLARWLVDERNPLTWRSLVNRVWHWHFGRGLVRTPNDFGNMGAAPVNQRLLDWLAVWFRDDAEGSLKRLHRLIVTSRAYRQVADSRAADDESPVWRGRRLDAEEIHDAMVAISGDLDLRAGGPSDRHFTLAPGIHVTPVVDYAAFDVGAAPSRRRSVYRFIFRTLPDPWMEALDCPSGDQLAPDRGNSVTVQQALALWNGRLTAFQSERLAARLEQTSEGLDDKLRRLGELAFGRSPDDTELREWGEHATRFGLPSLCRVIFNSNEFVFVP
jgi:hypothetical protein